jgi:HSP20 family molecular chaperone IbpA
MDPMDFFNHRNYFPSGQMPDSWKEALDPEDSLKKLGEIKQLVHKYRSVMNDQFWGQLNELNNKKVTILPIELWKNEHHIYLLVAAPGLKKMKNARITFHSDQDIHLKIRAHSLKPERVTQFIKSELPTQMYERTIRLPEPVLIDEYTSNFNQGVLKYIFTLKDNRHHSYRNQSVNIPFDF